MKKDARPYNGEKERRVTLRGVSFGLYMPYLMVPCGFMNYFIGIEEGKTHNHGGSAFHVS